MDFDWGSGISSDWNYDVPSWSSDWDGGGWEAPASSHGSVPSQSTSNWDSPEWSYTPPSPQPGFNRQAEQQSYIPPMGGESWEQPATPPQWAAAATYGQPDSESAHAWLLNQRELPGLRDNEALRGAEHAMFSQSMMDRFPGVGAAIPALGAPAYTALKWAAQTYPAYTDLLNFIPRHFGLDLTATPWSWNELGWGMSPLWRSYKR